MNLNKLTYPMFKITLNEAFLLVEANKRLGRGEYQEHLLCCALNLVKNHYPSESKAVQKLKLKITKVIDRKGYLSIFMRENGGLNTYDFVSHKLRKAWIKKLLAYNGY